MLINILFLLLILLSIFFLLESKSINIILDFIGIIILISLIFFNISNNIDFTIISYILIIIYGSALSIIFVFIIMLNKQIILPNLLLTQNIKLFYNNINPINYLFLGILFIYFIINFVNINPSFNFYNHFLEYNINTNVNLLYLYFNILFNSSFIQLYLIIFLLLLALIGIVFIIFNC